MEQLDLMQEAARWVDTRKHAKELRDRFTDLVNEDSQLAVHRTYIEKTAYGMGERCFHWLWKLLVDQMPEAFKFLEVGVYKGQVLSLIRLLAARTMREAEIIGVTLLTNSSGGSETRPNFPPGDYGKFIADLHDLFGQGQPTLIVGDSTDPEIQKKAELHAPLDLVYVDGCHEYELVLKDLQFYPQLLRSGGFLVVDDSANYLHQPFGFFQGIEDVSKAVRTVIETDPAFEHLLAVVHNRVWRKQ